MATVLQWLDTAARDQSEALAFFVASDYAPLAAELSNRTTATILGHALGSPAHNRAYASNGHKITREETLRLFADWFTLASCDSLIRSPFSTFGLTAHYLWRGRGEHGHLKFGARRFHQPRRAPLRVDGMDGGAPRV